MRLRKEGAIRSVSAKVICGAVARAARREAARAGKWPHFCRDDRSPIGARSMRLRKEGAIRSVSAKVICGAVARAARREAARAGK